MMEPPEPPGEQTLEALRERNRRFQLAYLLKMTESMLEHARSGEWQRLEELEGLRSGELQACSGWEADSQSELIAEALATLLQLNESLIEVVRFAREKLAAEQADQHYKVNAAKTYLSDS
jgi:hypothetical protein